MNTETLKKYRPFPQVQLSDRNWPNCVITQAPRWCSVDLRDGNQALAIPMNVGQKLDLFKTLVACGFKEIEIGFPSASKTEFKFLRLLIEGNHIPEDVTIQVLTQSRRDLIAKTIESLVGAKRVIIHMYNSTSPAQRRVVFGMSKQEIIAVAREGASYIVELLPKLVGTEVTLQYSPESFSATEVEFAKEISEAVMEVWQPTPSRKMILNLPCTVEVATPNVYADQIEWICRNIKNRDSLVISLHTHNDRNTGTAATELGLLAGADRVEGTLFGNGERTGNLDIITVALNLYTQGIDPKLDFSNIPALVEAYGRTTGMSVPPRHPYAGELVFTAFSGSHQDAIKKGLDEWSLDGHTHWDVPYLTIDPTDIGREYSDVIRVNGQSGKGGVAYILERVFGIKLPKDFQRVFGPVVNDKVDELAREVTPDELRSMLWQAYVETTTPYFLEGFTTHGTGEIHCCAEVNVSGISKQIRGKGNGPIAAFVSAICASESLFFTVSKFEEHSLSSGSAAKAIAYVEIVTEKGTHLWGVGVDTNSELAGIRAILSALNQGFK